MNKRYFEGYSPFIKLTVQKCQNEVDIVDTPISGDRVWFIATKDITKPGQLTSVATGKGPWK